VAIKQIQLRAGDSRSQLEVFREISALRNSHHENIVPLLDVIFGANQVAIVLGYVESSLKLVIGDVRRPVNTGMVRFYFRQLFFGLSYLHHLGIMHRVLIIVFIGFLLVY
jgi:serine/threonine protein kinase